MNLSFGTERPADIAKELNVSPQVINNWKLRDTVPYKYVKIIRLKISDINSEDESTTKEPTQNNDHRFSNENQLSSFDIIVKSYNEIKNNFKWFLPFPVLSLLLAIFYLNYIAIPVFESKAKILPLGEQSMLPAGIGEFGKSFGLNVGRGKVTLSSAEIIPEVLKSRSFALKILKTKYDTKAHGKNKKLINILSLKRDYSNLKLSTNDTTRAISNFIRNIISVPRIKNKELVQISIKSYEPELASQIADKVIYELEKTLQQNKKSKTSAQKTFINERIIQVLSKLTSQENALKKFRDENRNILASPALMLQQSRLMREVELQTQVYITLKTQLEMVQIEENESTKIMEVLDPPEKPILPKSPKFLETVIFCVLIGFFAGACFVYYKTGRLNYYIRRYFILTT